MGNQLKLKKDHWLSAYEGFMFCAYVGFAVSVLALLLIVGGYYIELGFKWSFIIMASSLVVSFCFLTIGKLLKKQSRLGLRLGFLYLLILTVWSVYDSGVSIFLLVFIYLFWLLYNVYKQQ